MRKPFRKECAYCSRKFETKNPKQDTCPNCKALLKFASGALAEAVNAQTTNLPNFFLPIRIPNEHTLFNE